MRLISRGWDDSVLALNYQLLYRLFATVARDGDIALLAPLSHVRTIEAISVDRDNGNSIEMTLDRAGIRLSALTDNAQRDSCKFEVGLEMGRQIMLRQSGIWLIRLIGRFALSV